MRLARTSGIAARLISVLITLFGISVFIFIVLRVIPGDTITGSLGIETGVLTPEQIEDLKRYYGIDKPLILQYFSHANSMRKFRIFSSNRQLQRCPVSIFWQYSSRN